MKEKITKELVFNLADQLATQGKKVTAMNIRAANGEHGNPSQITKFMNEWRALRAEDAVSAIPAMPEDKLLGVLSPVWVELVTAANGEYEEARQLFVEREEALQQDLQQCHDVIQAQDERLEEAKQLQADQAAKLSLNASWMQGARDEQAKNQSENAELTERNQQLTVRLEDKTKECVGLGHQLEDVRADLKKQQSAGVELSGQLRDTKAELGQSVAESKRRGAELATKVEALTASEELVEKWKDILAQEMTDRDMKQAEVEKDLAVTQVRLEAAEESERKVQQERETLGKDCFRLTEQLSAARSDDATKAATVEQLTERLAQSEGNAQSLQDQLVVLAGGKEKKK